MPIKYITCDKCGEKLIQTHGKQKRHRYSCIKLVRRQTSKHTIEQNEIVNKIIGFISYYIEIVEEAEKKGQKCKPVDILRQVRNYVSQV